MRFLFTSLLFLSPPVVQAADSNRLWSLRLDEKIRWFRETPAGPIVVGTDEEILGVSPDSGSVVWHLGPIKELDARDMEILHESPYVLLGLGNQKQAGLSGLSLLDPRGGTIVWNGQSLGVSRSLGSFIVPRTHRVLLRATTLPKDKQRTAALVELESGAGIWVNPGLGEAQEPLRYQAGKLEFIGTQVPLLDTDSTMIFHVSRSRFQRYEITTGRLLWDSADHPTGGLSLGEKMKLGQGEARSFPFQYAPMLTSPESDRFYAPYANTVAAFSVSTGSRLWKEVPKLGLRVAAEMRETPEGLLVRAIHPDGHEIVSRVYMLDRATGSVVWKSDDLDGCSHILVENDRVVVAYDGKLRAFSLRGGDEADIARLEFKGNDDAVSLRRVDKGYCVIGSSDLGIYSPQNGSRLASYYLPSPSGVGTGLFLLGLSVVTSSISPVHAGSGVTVSAGVDEAAAIGEILKDYSQSRDRDRFAYFLATVDGQDAIVRVRCDTGEIAGKVVLGSKEPRYEIDAGGRILFQPDDKSLQCYAFPAEP